MEYMDKMKNNIYSPIIGLEIHIELKTNSKMFCGCRNDPFHAEKPNIYTCPVCLGLPGALPVPNKKAIEMTVMAGLALTCRINKESRFDRKHYFYPDLPKGYQISQYEKPLAENGRLQVAGYRLQDKTIRIRRVHLEEDTGKLMHRSNTSSTGNTSNTGTKDREQVTLVDFNRSGVPLMEIVTEPDIRSAGEAKQVAQKIQGIVRFLGISGADMEKGSMRLEANVSLSKGPTLRIQGRTLRLPNYKVELKNINSFRFLERAINQEIARQKQILSSNKVVKQQTFGWDTEKQELKPQRVKEEAADYRYFPEPDIPPIRLDDRWIEQLKFQISDLPDDVYQKLVAAGVAGQAAEVISSNKAVAEKVLQVTGYRLQVTGREFGNWVVHHRKEAEKLTAEELMEMFRKEKQEVVEDEGQLGKWVQQAAAANQKAVEDYKKGKEAALQFLIGQVQKKAKGKADVIKVIKLIKIIKRGG